MRSRFRLLVGLLAVLGLLITSCSESVMDFEPQTLEEFMGWDRFDEQAAREAWFETSWRIEELTAECMEEKGIEYTAWLPPDFYIGEAPIYEVGLTDSEWKLRFGYGFFAAPLFEVRWTREHAEKLGEGNPNQEHHAPEGVEYWEESWACGDLAELEVRGEPVSELIPVLEEAWNPLVSAREDVQSDLENDSRLIGALGEWAACMAGKGYDFATEEDIHDYLSSKLDDFLSDDGEDSFPEAEIEPLAEEELAIAADDVACRAELDPLYEELRAEYEGRFIAEHREQLEKIRVLEQQLMQMRLEGKEPE